MHRSRSTDPRDYQDLEQAVAVMPKSFPAGFHIAPHTHARDQLLYAVAGTMQIRTATHAWIVPPDRALFMPSGIEHQVDMRGAVEMRTLYIARGALAPEARHMAVFAASPLLRALILALLDEPIAFGPGSRGDRIAALILDEIARAEPLALSVPMPRDKRLLKLCESLIASPDVATTLDDWADKAGASRRTLARLFQAECGMTFTTWRQRVRFHAALDALSSGEPVARVALACGYRSPSAFTAAFRQVLGVSPRGLPAAWAPPGTGPEARPSAGAWASD